MYPTEGGGDGVRTDLGKGWPCFNCVTYEEHIVSPQGTSPEPGDISEFKVLRASKSFRERGGKKPGSCHAEHCAVY